MPELQIKKETLPVRCEICHLSDQFEINTGICLRCSDLDIAALQKEQLTNKPNINIEDEFDAAFRKNMISALLVGFISSLILSIFFFHFRMYLPMFPVYFISSIIFLMRFKNTGENIVYYFLTFSAGFIAPYIIYFIYLILITR